MEVHRVTEGEVHRVAEVLSRAFEDDPVSCFIMPSDRRRRPGLREFFAIQMRADLLPFGAVFTTDDFAGAALWAPPGKPMPPPLRAMRSLVPMVPYIAGRNFSRALRFVSQVEAMHPREPHWYLATLGTEPARQGHGVGSALLGPVLARCDATGTRAYLESSKERNIPFYRRHGFEVTGQVQLGDGPPLWIMWREPRSARGTVGGGRLTTAIRTPACRGPGPPPRRARPWGAPSTVGGWRRPDWPTSAPRPWPCPRCGPWWAPATTWCWW